MRCPNSNVGAVAELFDISCLAGTPQLFDKVADAAIALWKIAPPNVTPQKVITGLSMLKNPVILGRPLVQFKISIVPVEFNSLSLLGQHFYVTNPITGSGVNPKWDFTSSGATAGNPDAFVVAARSFGTAAPTGSQDIDWVFLTNIGAGKLADTVYRTDTKLGQPAASCTPGSPLITVKYVSKYCKHLAFK